MMQDHGVGYFSFYSYVGLRLGLLGFGGLVKTSVVKTKHFPVACGCVSSVCIGVREAERALDYFTILT